MSGEADGAKPAAKAEEAPKPAIKPASEVVVKKFSFSDEAEDADEEEEIEAPKAKRAAKKEEPVKASGDLASIVDAWADEEDEGEDD